MKYKLIFFLTLTIASQSLIGQNIYVVDSVILNEVIIYPFANNQEFKQAFMALQTENYETLQENINVKEPDEKGLFDVEIELPVYSPFTGIYIMPIPPTIKIFIIPFYDELYLRSKKKKVAASGELPVYK